VSARRLTLHVMCKNIIPHIVLTFILSLLPTSICGSSYEQNIFNDFLHSKNINKRYKAFITIVSNDKKYRDIVLTKLLHYQENPDTTPEALIHLAAFLKDQRYILPLTKMINNTKYSENRCIYVCPIIFSLVIFDCFTTFSVTEGLNENVNAVEDLKRDIKWVKSISLKSEKASKYVTGPGARPLSEMETLPLAEVLKLAGPNTKDVHKRMNAAFVLQYGTVNDTYLAELYWLARTYLDDASNEYLNAVYQAIYRAETARKIKSHN
jgi:hypothetical protein